MSPKTRRPVVVESVQPEVDGGRFPVKRTSGGSMRVKTVLLGEEGRVLAGVLRYRLQSESRWSEVRLQPLGSDQWSAEIPLPEPGRYLYTVEAWPDELADWKRRLAKGLDAGRTPRPLLNEGADLVERAAQRASRANTRRLKQWAERLRSEEPAHDRIKLALDPALTELAERYPDRSRRTVFARTLEVWAEREDAGFCAWYQMFPRSSSGEPGKPGTLSDCAARVKYVADMGFDFICLTPVHPIGLTGRRGRNSDGAAGPEDPGDPRAVGSPEGGHRAIAPELGTFEDLAVLLDRAGKHGIQVALELPFTCSPDHPWVREHPDWIRPGSGDVLRLDFGCRDWKALWEELRDTVLFWAGKGIRAFRFDSPEAVPFDFWEWLLPELRKENGDLLFLAGCDTRPRVERRLAKAGFTQVCTRFLWHSSKEELMEDFKELAESGAGEYLRPCLQTNSPDNLSPYLRNGGRQAFEARLVLAATLGAVYGVFGPAFELCEDRTLEPGSENYRDSERYESRYWNLRDPRNIQWLISRVNTIRRENPALRRGQELRFHETDNERLLCYSKRSGENVILTAVNLDPHHTQRGDVRLPIGDLGIGENEPYDMHDLLTGARYRWRGPVNSIELRNESGLPAHIFRLEP